MKTIKIKDYSEVPKNFTGIAEYSANSNGWYLRRWLKEGKWHREDGPAVEFADGTKHWYREGKRHREDGPAIEYSNGNKEWWFEGKRHRIDGPAVEYTNGYKEWFIEDICYSIHKLQSLIENFLYLGKEKGKYNLEWLRFLTDQGIKEFPIIPGMEKSYLPFLLASLDSLD